MSRSYYCRIAQKTTTIPFICHHLRQKKKKKQEQKKKFTETYKPMKIPTTNRSSTAWGLWFVLLVVPIPVVTAQLQNLINLFFGYGEYGFEIAYVGVPPLDRFWFFRRAALKWSNVITQDVRDVNDARFLQFSTDCGPLPQQVDDVYICASYKIIDGPGGVLGVGFPRLLRNNNLVSHAELNIDQADVQSLKGAGILRNLIVSLFHLLLGERAITLRL